MLQIDSTLHSEAFLKKQGVNIFIFVFVKNCHNPNFKRIIFIERYGNTLGIQK